MPWSSNATFLVTLRAGDETGDAVYKPLRGERELWDFPDGLYRREAAAFALSHELGWGLVPETIVREEGLPFGLGSLQRFVPADFEQHYFTLLERPEHLDRLRAIATFDLLSNNADRKGGHCLLGLDGQVWAIDNGLCFHDEPKLRTVMWDFAGEAIPDSLVRDVERALPRLADAVADLLDGREIGALLARAEQLVAMPTFPHPTGRHPFPWPLL